ncbi:phage holin family protein [Limimaricola pyoseonensis]|uniref:Putative Holin-X, holin superfamily III n=1 Tax=Limimaricola pyoseonensis TaxID=521013 RepID=A0A1G7F404_9RHOB|nr:phage holin family protein [Limimaricola pyoseonensis]SDE70648.1 Putative Holin-X, holin superfamily III [Limimaricola pyoseonensis]
MSQTDPRFEDARNAAPRGEAKSMSALLSEAMSHVSGLVRKEADLAKAEAQRALSRAGMGIGLVVAAVVLSLTALDVLAAAFVAWLAEAGLGAGLSALIVGGVILVIAAILVKVGLNRIKAVTNAPKRSAESIRKDAAAVKGAIND